MRSVYAVEADFLYLKKKGIPYAEFFRQAIKAHKKNKFKYNYDYKK